MPQFNYQTNQYEETDEERQAREEAEKRAGTTVVGETKVKQYQDGSQTETITKEIAAPSFGDRVGQAVQQAGTNFANNLSRGVDNIKAAPERFAQNMQAIPGQVQQRLAPGPVAPTGFQGQTDEFGGVDAAIARQAQMPTAPAPQAQMPAQPVAPQSINQQAYNANIARQESGANPNIGYHDRSKGTASGMYGITDAAYQDARRLDPSLPADKMQATPEQQTAAMNAFTQQNARYLQGYGIQPTANTLAAAHFAGAKGLSDFMTRRDEQGRPYISPAAQAANGGYDKAAAIINSRLGGQAAPASGALNQPPPAPAQAAPAPEAAAAPTAPVSPYSLSTGQSNQGIRMPGAQPVGAPDAAATAINRYQEIQNDPNELMKFAFDDTTPDYLKQRAKDSLVEKYDQEKKIAQATKEAPNLTAKQAADAIQGRSKSGVGDWLQYLLLKHVGLTDLANEKGEQLGIGHKWTQSTITGADGTDIAVELQTTASGKVLGGNRLDGTALTSQELNLAGGAMGKKLNIVGGTYINDKTNEVGRVVSDEKTGKSYIQTDTGRKPMAGFRPQATGGSLEQQGATQLQKLRNDLQFKGPEAAAKALGEFDAMNGTRYLDQYKQNAPQFFQTIGMAPPGQPAAGGSAGAAPGAATTTTAPATTTTTIASPADITSGKKVTEAERVQFVEKVLPEINKKGEDGRYVADTRRTQVSMLTGPGSAIMGIYRGTGTEYDKARAVLRDAIAGTYSGKEGGERFSEALRGITIPDEQMSKLKEFAQLNTGINAKTLAENAGEGPKSDADIKLNQAANMTNIGDLPAFAALSGLTRSQFAGDINKRKQDFVLANRDKYQTQSQVEQAWGKEKDMLNRQYEGIYKERLNFVDAKMVEKFGKDWRKRPSDETQGFYRDASIHSFNVLPTPNYDVQTQKFVYPTQQSKLAAMRAVTGR